MVVIPRIKVGDIGVPAVPHHIQCGGGCSGVALGRGDGRGSRRAGLVRTEGQTPTFPLLSG